jgi:quercetin dioxygenase-like cupin family protein
MAEGKLFLFLDEEKHFLAEGDVFIIPSGVQHCIQTVSKHVRLVDSFSPVREDFLRRG